MNRRMVVLYCVCTLLASWAIQLAGLRAVADPSSPNAVPWHIAAMAVPGLVALAFLALHPPARRSMKWGPGNPWMLSLAVLIPTLGAFACVTLVLLLGWGTSGWFSFSLEGVSIAGGPWLLGLGAQSWPTFLANVALTGAAFAGLSSVVALGEELGWRGFLQGHLIAQMGLARGLTTLGLMWSFYHLPVLLGGYNYPEHPVLGALVLFPVALIADSFFLAWLTLRARSFWPAALAHGAVNSIAEGVVADLRLVVPQLYLDLLRLGVAVAVGLLCWAALARRSPVAGAPGLAGAAPDRRPARLPGVDPIEHRDATAALP